MPHRPPRNQRKLSGASPSLMAVRESKCRGVGPGARRPSYTEVLDRASRNAAISCAAVVRKDSQAS
jgi:hypothetical protein